VLDPLAMPGGERQRVALEQRAGRE
jgi:hypothetical protein